MLLVAVVAAGVVLIALSRSSRTAPPKEPAGVKTYQVDSRQHVEGPVDYPQAPPVGGSHSALYQNCGFYPTPIVTENAIHSLEHGAVWITYRPDVPKSQVDEVRKLAKSTTYVLASPFAGQEPPVVGSAWGKQLQLESATDPRLKQFVRAFRSGPQTPERGAACSGGVGRPS